MKNNSQRYQAGAKILKKVHPKGADRVHDLLQEISPDMARLVVEFPYGEIWSRGILDLKTRELITIASLTTLGHAKDQLRAHIHNALNIGCRKEEIIEVIIHMCVYAGFPASINALFAVKDVLKERGLL